MKQSGGEEGKRGEKRSLDELNDESEPETSRSRSRGKKARLEAPVPMPMPMPSPARAPVLVPVAVPGATHGAPGGRVAQDDAMDIDALGRTSKSEDLSQRARSAHAPVASMLIAYLLLSLNRVFFSFFNDFFILFSSFYSSLSILRSFVPSFFPFFFLSFLACFLPSSSISRIHRRTGHESRCVAAHCVRLLAFFYAPFCVLLTSSRL